MANTPNLDLEKPLGTDKALVARLNSNSDKIDAWAGTTNQAITNINTKVFKGNADPKSNVDCDTLEEGLHFISTGAINGPGPNWFYLDAWNYTSGAKSQIARTLTNRTFSRMHNGQAWTAWQELALKSELITTQESSGYFRFDDPSTGIGFGINPTSNRMFIQYNNGTIKYFNLTAMT